MARRRAGRARRPLGEPLIRSATLLGLVALAACKFEPIAREPVLERVIDRPVRVERALGAGGARVLVSAQGEDGARTFSVANWAVGRSCDLPADTRAVLEPLAPASASEPLRLPIARAEGDAFTLWLADMQCAVDGPLAGILPDSARPIELASRGETLLTFRDAADTLYTLDGAGRVRAIAQEVRSFQLAAVSANPLEDVLWVHEAGQLTQRTVDGALRVRLGDDVREFAVFDSLLPRVAYVDGDDIYEASGPSYVPALRVRDACHVRYGATTLEFHTPCSEQQLVRVSIGPGDVETFPRGVYAARNLGVMRLEYARDEAGDEELYVSSADFERHAVTPVLLPDSLRVLDGTYVAGRTAAGQFGVWSTRERAFQLVFEGVDSENPLVQSATTSELVVFHHALDASGAGILSTFSVRDRSTRELARGVPRQTRGGFVLDAGGYFADYPATSPVLVFIEDASPVPGVPDTLKGRLRAELLSGELGSDLSEEVSSFTLVTTPLPGLIVAAEDGARAGLWFAAL